MGHRGRQVGRGACRTRLAGNVGIGLLGESAQVKDQRPPFFLLFLFPAPLFYVDFKFEFQLSFESMFQMHIKNTSMMYS
jgi:hypothetical protein